MDNNTCEIRHLPMKSHLMVVALRENGLLRLEKTAFLIFELSSLLQPISKLPSLKHYNLKLFSGSLG